MNSLVAGLLVGLLAILIATVIAYFAGYLNKYLPASMKKAAFAPGSALYGPTAAYNAVPSTLTGGATSCFVKGDPTFTNLCGLV